MGIQQDPSIARCTDAAVSDPQDGQLFKYNGESGKWENKTGGGGGTVETIVQGDGISVDATDPANPVVACTVTPGIASVSADPNPQLGGDLDANDKNIDNAARIHVDGTKAQFQCSAGSYGIAQFCCSADTQTVILIAAGATLTAGQDAPTFTDPNHGVCIGLDPASKGDMTAFGFGSIPGKTLFVCDTITGAAKFGGPLILADKPAPEELTGTAATMEFSDLALTPTAGDFTTVGNGGQPILASSVSGTAYPDVGDPVAFVDDGNGNLLDTAETPNTIGEIAYATGVFSFTDDPFTSADISGHVDNSIRTGVQIACGPITPGTMALTATSMTNITDDGAGNLVQGIATVGTITGYDDETGPTLAWTSADTPTSDIAYAATGVDPTPTNSISIDGDGDINFCDENGNNKKLAYQLPG